MDHAPMDTKVLVNGRALSQRVTGVQRYAIEILRCLGSRVQLIRPDRAAQGPAGHAWEQFSLPRQVTARSILWSPANTGPLVVQNQVLSLADLSPLEHPEWFQPAFAAWYRLFLPILARRVKLVVTLSDHVRQKMITHFRLPAERVIVIPAGVDHNRFCLPRQPHRMAKPLLSNRRERYILFVGSLEPRKNLPGLLAAWKQIEPRHPSVSLVLAGVSGPVFRQARFPKDQERVRFAGYVPDADLPALYAGADVFVLPSFDEGFGLPVLEAMACGAPVVASTGGALPEVVGNAGLLVDPHNPLALAEALDACLADADLRSALRQRGLQRAQRYSWSSSAEKIWQVLQGTYAA